MANSYSGYYARPSPYNSENDDSNAYGIGAQQGQYGNRQRYSLSNSPYQDQSNVINLQGQNSRKSFNSSNILQRSNTVERVSSIIGPMYCFGFLAGSSVNCCASLLNQQKKNTKALKSRKIFVSKMLNSVLKGGEKCANISGGITLLFLCVCKLNNFLFLEEQEMIGQMASNVLNGTFSGLLVGAGMMMSKPSTVTGRLPSSLTRIGIPALIGSTVGYFAYYMTTRSSRLRGIV